MSSLLQGLTFVRRSEGDNEQNVSAIKKHKTKKKKKKQKTKSTKRKGEQESAHTKRHRRRRESDSDRETDDEEEKDEQTMAKTALPRDEWMLMPFEPSGANESALCKTAAEGDTDRKQKKVQAEIDAGMREPVTGMVYGLYDPKNPDAEPTVSRDMVQGKEAGTAGRTDRDMPVFGDGGASWRAKMLRRAADRSRASGVALEDVVNERFESVSALKSRARGSARDHAHLQYKRHRTDEGETVNMVSAQRRTLGVRQDAKDKTLLSKYSRRVQQSVVTHNLDVDLARSQPQTNASSSQRGCGLQDDDEELINYDKLPCFEDRNARAKASKRVVHRERIREDNKNSSRKDYRRGEGPDRSQSCIRERPDLAKRSRRSEGRSRSRSRSQSRHRHRSPVGHGSNSPHSNKTLRDRHRTTSPTAEKLEAPTQATAKCDTNRSCRTEAEAHAERLIVQQRNAFLYGSKKSTASSAADKSGTATSRFVTEQHTPFASGVDKTLGSSTRSSTPSSYATRSPDKEDGKAVLNKLAAKALRAQMMGKAALFRKLTEELNELEAKLERQKTAAAVPHFEAINGALPPLEKEDMRCGSRKGKKKFAESIDAGNMDVAASLEALVREERLSRVHVENGDMDSANARNIVRLDSRYKGTEVNAQNLSSGFDEEEQVDMRMLRQPGSNLTRRARSQREHVTAVNETKGWDERTRKCQLCMKSQAFKKHLMLSLGEFTYLAAPNRPRLHPGHCMIVLIDHTCSVVQVDEQAIEEIARFQRALTRMCEQQYGKSMVFIEQTSAPHWKRHTMVECIPVDRELALDIPLYFKQELVQADGEWSTHKPIIDTSKGGIRNHVPPMFPYFHIQWCTRESRGGYAHVIEDENKFPRDFGVNVVAGMLDVTPPNYGRRETRNRRSLDDEKRDVLAFLEEWKPHDWTQDLDGGGIEENGFES